MNYKELSKEKPNVVEGKILKKWQEENILDKTIKNRENNETWVFYDGPIYANAKPGIHHVFSKTIKDAFCKYKTMNGYRVLRKIGLDTHGLPIEVNVEKKLGFKSKSDIEEFGVENFCKECNKETASNIDEVKKVTDMMGQFIDCDHPYVTCDNEYIESEWWIIKEMDKKGRLTRMVNSSTPVETYNKERKSGMSYNKKAKKIYSDYSKKISNAKTKEERDSIEFEMMEKIDDLD